MNYVWKRFGSIIVYKFSLTIAITPVDFANGEPYSGCSFFLSCLIFKSNFVS